MSLEKYADKELGLAADAIFAGDNAQATVHLYRIIWVQSEVLKATLDHAECQSNEHFEMERSRHLLIANRDLKSEIAYLKALLADAEKERDEVRSVLWQAIEEETASPEVVEAGKRALARVQRIVKTTGGQA